MWLIDQLFKAIAGDPNRLPPHPLDEEERDVSHAFVEAIRERRTFRNRAYCFERELRANGWKQEQLDAMVELYERGLRVDANVRARG